MNSSGRVRLKDIAEELGVSVVTVSKGLRNSSKISSQMRARILKRARELDYQPNTSARRLVTGRSQVVGLIVPDLVHPFFALVAKSVAASIRPSGYSLMIASTEEDPALETQQINAMLAHGVDGLILASCHTTNKAPVLQRIKDFKVPFVFVDRSLTGLRGPFVGVDDVAVGEMATSHLIDRGCRQVAHIRGPKTSTGNGRFKGYRHALAEHDLPFRAAWVVASESPDDHGEVGGFGAANKLLSLRSRPDGIFCYNDITAFGAMKAIADAGLAIPDDIAVIGVSNLSGLMAGFGAVVPLSSIDQNPAGVGEEAARLVINLALSGQLTDFRRVLLSPRLVERGSTSRMATSSDGGLARGV